jgi:hypothetical protein
VERCVRLQLWEQIVVAEASSSRFMHGREPTAAAMTSAGFLRPLPRSDDRDSTPTQDSSGNTAP